MKINGSNVIWSATIISRDKEVIEEILPLNDTISGMQARISIEIMSEPHPTNPDNRVEYSFHSPAVWSIRCYGFSNTLGESLSEPITIGAITQDDATFKFQLLFTHQMIGKLHQMHIQIRANREVENA
jgi:hypothetical protein